MYLDGKSFDLIESVTGVSKASVVNIVRGMGGYDPDHILMRALAVNLRKNGSDSSQYASIIRMSGVLDENGVNYATCEECLENFFLHATNCSGNLQPLCTLYTSFYSLRRDMDTPHWSMQIILTNYNRPRTN